MRPVHWLCLLLCLGACSGEPKPKPVPDSATVISDADATLPDADFWRHHLDNDLMRYWKESGQVTAAGQFFPTFICLDGKPYIAGDPCPAFVSAGEWIRENLQRTFVRMHSRQTFAYGVAYHMTGDEAYLVLMKQGVDVLLQTARDAQNGGFVSVLEGGEPVYEPLQRTTQDLAYAQLGLAFYYYLTRDAEVLTHLIAVKDHIFQHYWDSDWGMLRWVVADSPSHSSGSRELVAQLDQVNGYMLLVLPTLEGQLRLAWERDLRRVMGAMLQHFHNPDEHRFYGVIDTPDEMVPWGRHGDYGHTIKAYWMLRQVGLRLGEQSWVGLAEKGIEVVLEKAYIPPGGQLPGRWREGVRRGGEPGDSASWWAYAELNQAAATLSLVNPSYAGQLVETYAFWHRYLVDPQQGGVFHATNGNGEPWRMKAHHWKNAYHETEHALVAMITGEAYASRPLALYFAFAETPPDALITPYFFSGEIQSKETSALNHLPSLSRTKITFKNLR